MANNKDKKILNVPALRFPEFCGEWKEVKLSKVIKVQGGYAFKSELFQQSGVPIIRISNLPQNVLFVNLNDCVYYSEGNYHNFEVHKGDLLIAMSGATTGKTAIYNNNSIAYLNQRVGCFKVKSDLFYSFLYALVETKSFKNQLNKKLIAGAQPNISSFDIESIKVTIPGLIEQQKIAKLIGLLNERIDTQNKIIEKLETLIKGIVELAFSHAATSNTLGCHITQISQRNKNGKDLPVLSVSNKYGFVEQSEQFEDRIIASDDTSNYKIVSINDFAFNPARINVGSIARLKDKECGIVSPMYICFRTSKDILPEYLELFFKTVTFSSEVGKRLEGSVRLCLSFESLCEIVIPVISIREQQSLVKMATAFYSKLDVEKGILRSYQSQKQYLLSQMFI